MLGRAALALGVAIFLAACGGGGAGRGTGASTVVTESSIEAAPATAAAPDAPSPLAFTAPMVGGATFNGTVFRGAAFVWFWAPT